MSNESAILEIACDTVLGDVCSFESVCRERDIHAPHEAVATIAWVNSSLTSASRVEPKAERLIELILSSSDDSAHTRSILTGLFSLVAPLQQAEQYTGLLFKEFGTLNNIVRATFSKAFEVTGLSRECWLQLQLMHKLLKTLLREPLLDRPLLSNLGAVKDYLAHTMAHEKVESIRVLFLDSRNHLILDEEHSRGDHGYAPFYIKKLIVRACDLGAAGLLIVHNHPSGIETPSLKDIFETSKISHALSQVGVKLLDHLIVGNKKFFSFLDASGHI